MNIKLAVKYSLILFSVTFLIGAIFSFTSGVIFCGFAPCETPIPIEVNIAKSLTVQLSMLICFIVFSKNNKETAWQICGLVVAIIWLASYPINVILMGVPQERWLYGLIGLVVSMTLGVVVGQRLKTSAEKAPNK